MQEYERVNIRVILPLFPNSLMNIQNTNLQLLAAS